MRPGRGVRDEQYAGKGAIVIAFRGIGTFYVESSMAPALARSPSPVRFDVNAMVVLFNANTGFGTWDSKDTDPQVVHSDTAMYVLPEPFKHTLNPPRFPSAATLTALGATSLILGLSSLWIRGKLFLTNSVLAMSIGIILGPKALK